MRSPIFRPLPRQAYSTERMPTTESGYFSRGELPLNMAGEKCTKEQVLLCFAFHDSPDQPTQFD